MTTFHLIRHGEPDWRLAAGGDLKGAAVGWAAQIVSLTEADHADIASVRHCARMRRTRRAPDAGRSVADRLVRTKHGYGGVGRASAVVGLLVLGLLILPWSSSPFANAFSVSLDLDDADGNQAVSTLDVPAGQFAGIQVFGSGIRDARRIVVQIGRDAGQVVYLALDAGDAMPGALVGVERDSAWVKIDVLAATGTSTMNEGMVGTAHFLTTEAFSETEIRLQQVELYRDGQVQVIAPRVSVVLHLAAPPSPDFDGSGRVDFADFILFASAFGHREGGGQYRGKYDLNGDGYIGFEDFVTFAGSFGTMVNRAPVSALAPPVTRSVPENTPAGMAIGNPVSATDPDGDALTYSLWGVDAVHFAIDAGTGQVRTRQGVDYDYEERNGYSVVVRVSDGRGGRTNVVVGIAIRDVEELGPPARPAVPRVTQVLRGLRVDWTSPPDNGSTIHDYDVQYRAGESGDFTDWAHDGPVTTTTITGLENTMYQVQVRAVNPEGKSDWSPSGKGRPLAPGEIAVHDSSLRSVVAEALAKPGTDSPIYADDMALLTTLRASSRGIRNLEGLQYAVNLRNLSIGYNLINDISPLSGLSGLKELWINSNPISDASGGISPLTGLRLLENLHLQSVGVTDFSPLASLTNLKTLYLGFADHAPAISQLSGLADLEGLYFVSSGLSDISLLASLAKLRVLDLGANDIADLSPLAGLTRLETVNLRSNEIADISPLVANAGLNGADDEIDLRNNPLNETSVREHVTALQARNVCVLYDEILITVVSEPQIYNDNVFVVPTPGVDLRTEASLSSKRMIEVINGFYGSFRDEFDFLFVIANLQRGEGQYPFFGVNYPVSNQVRGIGQTVYSDEAGTFDSGGRLKCLLFLVERDGIRKGPMLHELMHQWAAYAVVDGFGGHWGFSSANGQLGGFAVNNLVDLGNGRYTAGHVVPYGYADNSVPYSPIELYLAGLVPADRVPDLLVAEGASWLRQDGRLVLANGSPMFTATGIRNYTIEDIVAEYGARDPGFEDSQKEFRAAAIFLIDRDHPGTREQLDAISADVSWFSMDGDDGDGSIYNFHEATRGVATIRMDGLDERRK